MLPLLIVVVSGVLGMLLARHFLRTPAVTATVAQTGAAADAVPDQGKSMPLPPALPEQATAPVRPQAKSDEPHAEVEMMPAQASAGTPGYQVEDGLVQLALRRWQNALLTNDAAEIAPSYAKQVDRYFLQTGVNRAFVRAYLQGQESRGWRLTAFTLQNVAIQHVSAGEVDVRFVAGYAATTGIGGRAGSARTLLKLRPEDGDWKIFYERDFNA